MKKFHSENVYVSHLLLKVENMNRAKEFYQNIMGLKILQDKGEEVQLTANGKTAILTLMEPEGIQPKQQKRTGLYHVAILLPDILQLGLFLKNVRDQSYPIVGGSNHGVSNAIYLQDPDDNGIEVYADMDPNKWERKDEKIKMVTLPLDYNKLIRDTGDRKWEGAPTSTIIGHIHLHVKDLAEADQFYMEGLGLDLVSKAGKSASFYSSKGYHHHIAANIWNGEGAKPIDENSVGMEYYTLKFPNRDRLKKTFNRLIEKGYNVYDIEGVIFVEDPSSNLIQLTCI